MPLDPRPFITITLDFDTHPKIEALSDRAAWQVIRLLIWSAKADKDGKVPEHRWTKVPAALRKEMLRHEVVEPIDDGVRFRDYLRHQLSAAERKALSAKRSDAGARGAHERWHVGLNVTNPSCEFCPKNGDEPPASDEDEEMASAMASAMADPMASAWQTDGRDNSRGTTPDKSSAAISSPVGGEQNGGGEASSKWRHLQTALTKAKPSVMWNGWTRDDTTEADELLRIHGSDLLYKTATEGNAPGNAKAWLTRWQNLDRPKPKVYSNCPIHGSHEGHTCTPCAADIKAGYDPATGEKLRTA